MSLTRLEQRYIKARIAGKVLNPVPGYEVSLDYGVRGTEWAAGYHTGEDHACPIGTPVVAVTWGHIVGAGWAGAPHDWGSPYGNVVLVQQENGKHTYGYCHLSQIHCRVGQAVVPGQVVAYSGNTGHVLGTGHCHFEARTLNGSYGDDVDPMFVKQEGYKP